ncbi:MAG TPA: cation:proton antiporter, partial [Chitinophagaceae bacterium]|nr:cation:proton antiporter [Chitinophagaceae bacterium]
IIILQWSERIGFFDKFLGDKTDNIINNSNKSIFICQIAQPLVLQKRIVIVAPPLAEHENGFSIWVTKISKLAQELSIPIQIYCNKATYKAIEKTQKKFKLNIAFQFIEFEDWEDFLVLSRNILSTDLFILISARKSATSYINVLESLPVKLEKYFSNNSRIIIYPQQFVEEIINDQFNDFSSEPLNKSIEAVQRIGKGIGSILKK